MERTVSHLVNSLLEMTSVPSRCLMSLSRPQRESGFVRILQKKTKPVESRLHPKGLRKNMMSVFRIGSENEM